jgi:hypothetical protein
MSGARTAACVCGALTAACQGEPVRVSACHCLACQQRTGSAFSVQARFNEDQVTIAGPRGQWTRVGDGGLHITHEFCPTCGGTLAWRIAEAPGVIAIAVGAFADPTFPAPVRSIYEERMHPWLTLTGIEEHEH